MLIGQRVLVAGGGVAGYAVARALALRGASVELAEAGAADAAAAAGGGLQITPNGMRVLDALGLGEAARDQGLASQAVVLRDGLLGGVITRLDLGPHRAEGLEYRLFHRADLVALLAEGAREAGVKIRTGAPVEVLSDGAEARARVAGDEVSTPLLLCADGFHSSGRPVLNGPADPFFTGQVAWRAVIPADRAVPSEVQAYLGPGQHLITYPLRGGDLRNIVAVEDRRNWAAEGWNHVDAPQNLRDAFSGFCPEVRALLEQVESPRLWGLFRHEIAARWHGQGLALLGDAAHPTLPFMAQGANMALEDAWVLADCLDAMPQPEALAAYQALRLPRVRRAIAAANANARNYHLRGFARYGAHKVLKIGGWLAPGAALKRFDWLYRHDVTKAQ
ncbi:FAD-dependent monooxygenase [Frigidibacter sp. ROC022]|uniref:FAD-dependent monooxygenase n=1 Tax=Frigidibacter sp. ROC022 TaxID=2971796 RepID=UPI00215B4776|nr:FAD-dependent monooxygenase [Frigidibacter sp. ROC022]MCR8723877.1 FAD-dependent monooxygenase [Frigidibacter sp. ROC022]